MNLFLGIIELLICFSGVVVLDKLFGKYGLFVWMALAIVFANIQVTKQIDIVAGFSTTLGNVAFASTYLTTDILNEKYGEASSKNAVKISAAALVSYIFFSQLTRLYVPNEFDMVSPGMNIIFSMAFRITAASGVMFLLSNWCDVIIYQKLKKKMNGKYMWFRNNAATVICNCTENFAFTYLAFLGTEGMSFAYCTEIALTASLLEMLIAVCDTPFLYFSTMKSGRTGILLEAENDEKTIGKGTAEAVCFIIL